MHGTRRLRYVFATLGAAAVTLAASPVAAAVPLTITPGGSAEGHADELVISSGGTVLLTCYDVTLPLEFGDGGATIPDPPGLGYRDCGDGTVVLDLDQVGDWHLLFDGLSDGVATGRIVDVAANIVGPGCFVKAGGTVNVTYTDDTGLLAWIPDETLAVTGIDPVENCFGLIHEGQPLAAAADFVVTPRQIVSE